MRGVEAVGVTLHRVADATLQVPSNEWAPNEHRQQGT